MSSRRLIHFVISGNTNNVRIRIQLELLLLH